ncbi:RNA polymerase sigma factor [Ornithinibacillus bavariensis]|uniref:RNA polymerase sigma factor n=1 Tax=Ornithinibacillus bavariensis TaxID=545502 RepID=UPI000EE9C539|nr:RNA polymerase sigma factor [Ornithinibacillus sp.]
MNINELRIESIINKLYHYCLTLTTSKWHAEDLVQETLIKVLLLKQKEPNRDMNLTFLYTIARNLFMDEKRREPLLLSEFDGLLGSGMDSTEWDSLLEILYSQLPLRQAMLITLKDVFHYTSEEISQMLRTSNESVKTALHRARKKLREDHESVSKQESNSSYMIQKITQAIKKEDAHKIFYYYRLLETRNYTVKGSRVKDLHFIFLSDPDGNILQINT